LAPPDATILLQGDHMLYLLNGDTPSEATWIRLGDLPQPSANPTAVPTQPSVNPTAKPTAVPTVVSTFSPTLLPSTLPTNHPSFAPSVLPTVNPTAKPSRNPTLRPSILPTFNPSCEPTVHPSPIRTAIPSFKPSKKPTSSPIFRPSKRPVNIRPTKEPTEIPTFKTSAQPTQTTAEIQFTQSLTLTVSSGCFNLNADLASRAALELTTAQSMQVQKSDVNYIGCVTSSARAAAAVKVDEFKLSMVPVSVNMDVNIPLWRYAAVVPSDPDSVQSLYSSLQKNVVGAVRSGNFTISLEASSKYFNATTTTGAVVFKTTSSGMTIENQPTPEPSGVPLMVAGNSGNSSMGSENMKYVIGIAIAVAILLMIAAAFVVAYFRLAHVDKTTATEVINEQSATDVPSGSKAYSSTDQGMESKS